MEKQNVNNMEFGALLDWAQAWSEQIVALIESMKGWLKHFFGIEL